ncbi:twin-arginine translocation pathway signal protein [Sulfurimonas lithotrophica]|uniref:Twin-arginine translocation pathway signal protein n=1 Tax=Sulfurimonas lithotrophica TaxID=2590022 RepID=A0A5P8P0K7_9BACT|nr:M15 family metallopeptidase [Sulfurimonas lithotrophica]QFR49140.1 twin-arginine translocation pathway signal protein [Sulfurimonas lithotrophica]
MKRRDFLLTSILTPVFAKNLLANDTDIYLTANEWRTLVTLNQRLKRLRRYVGFANFNIISYTSALYYGRNYSRIGEFSKEELNLIDKLFHERPSQYGFFGIKTCENIENEILLKDVSKIPYTGHYLFKGQPEKDYKNLLADVGPTLILTSGVRNVIKQLSLYVNKIYYLNGNVTQASNSIAPPAYSYHTISDFDVGRKGWGYKNFTADFATTDEFYKMRELDYIGMRYDKNNNDGVRFEPWHVEVI